MGAATAFLSPLRSGTMLASLSNDIVECLPRDYPGQDFSREALHMSTGETAGPDSTPARLEAAAMPMPRHLLSIDERHSVLADVLASDTRNGWRITTQTDTTASLTKGGTNHLLHFFIGLVTLTVWWWAVWPWWAMTHRKRQRFVSVDEWGTVRRS